MTRKTATKIGSDFLTKFVGGVGSAARRGVGKNITTKPVKKFELGKAKLFTNIGKDGIGFLFDENDWNAFRDNVNNLSKYARKIALVGTGTVATFVFVPPIAAASVFCEFGAAAAGATYTACNIAVPLCGASIMVKECNKVGKSAKVNESNEGNQP